MIVGYTTGTFDLFHSGHVEFLRKAKSLCDRLIVGVTSDELGLQEKKRKPIISITDRLTVVQACRYVDLAVIHSDSNGDKVAPYLRYKFDRVFIGDDYINDPTYTTLDDKIPGIKVIFLPYSQHISSTKIRNNLNL